MADKTEGLGGELVQLVTFRLGADEFGADVGSVREITRVGEITHMPDAPGSVKGVTNLRGQIIPVLDLAKQFGLDYREELPESARIVVTEIQGQTIGMLVDEVPEVLTMPKEDIEPTPELIRNKVEMNHDYIRGVGKLDGRLIIVVDLDRILALEQAVFCRNSVPARFNFRQIGLDRRRSLSPKPFRILLLSPVSSVLFASRVKLGNLCNTDNLD